MGSTFIRFRCGFYLIVTVGWLSAIAIQGLFADEPDSGLDLTVVPLDELGSRLDAAPRDRYRSGKAGEASYESILCEFIRRAEPAAEQILSQRLAAIGEKKVAIRDAIQSLPKGSAEIGKQERLLEELNQDLELVTALRRTKKQPDPLAVVIDLPKDLEAWTRELPAFKVMLQNVDADKRELWFQDGGDYRSGRHARWRIHVWDSEGNLLPELPSPSFVGGGILGQGKLALHETWDVTLPLESYVRIRTPGKYKLQVLYHDSETIADFESPKDLEGLIVFQSKVFELNVEHGPMITIDLKADSTEQAKSLMSLLDENTPLKIVIGDYDEEAQSFISPQSPEGQLLTMEWQAVPALIAAQENEQLSFKKRAWILTLLYSITLEYELSPIESETELLARGILPDYEIKGTLVSSTYWNGGASYGFVGDGQRSGGKENLKVQLNFAKKWLRFREEYLDVQSED